LIGAAIIGAAGAYFIVWPFVKISVHAAVSTATKAAAAV
jgi:hypothetical protein